MQEESGQRRQGRRPRLVVSAGMLSQFYFKAFIALVLICVYFGAGLAFYMTTEQSRRATRDTTASLRSSSSSIVSGLARRPLVRGTSIP